MNRNYQVHQDPLGEKTFKFAIRVVQLCNYLKDEKKEYILSKQILRSGTSPGAMVKEAQNAETGKDFIHKLAIAQKEIAETEYWLDLLFETNYLEANLYNSLKRDSIEIMKILRSSILTKKRNEKLK